MADIPLEDDPDEELGGPLEVKEKPSYVTRAVAARQRAGLDVKSEPRQSRGLEVRADDVIIIIDDDGNEVQVEVPAPEVPPLLIKIEHKDIPKDPEEPTGPVLKRSTRNRAQRQPFSPTVKGPYHKAVGFAESGESFRSAAPHGEVQLDCPSDGHWDLVGRSS